MSEPLALRTALGIYPHTQALRSGAVRSDLFKLDFAEIPTIHRAFAPMVREQRFDVSEMAIATFLQAKAYGKELVLLPVTMAARFQESALLCRSDSDIDEPSALAGRRVGVRAYSQTTGMWLRGVLAETHGVRPEQIRWITFEGAHVAEYQDPPWVERAPAGADLLAMLRAGEVDAIIVGNDKPDDPAFRSVFPGPTAAADAFWRVHHLVPVNHMVTVRRDLVERHPELIPELLRLFRDARDAVLPSPDVRKILPFGRAALDPAVALALRYAAEQGLLPQPMTLADVWQGSPPGIT